MRTSPCTILAVVLIWSVMPGSVLVAGQIAPEAVALNREIEDVGEATGVSTVRIDGASGDTALALAPDAHLIWGLRLGAGPHTLLLHAYAPAGDQDGFFVLIDGTRTRRVAPIGHWGVLAYPFAVTEPSIVTFCVKGQEPGVTLDRVAVVRGHWKDNDLPLGTWPKAVAETLVAPADLPRVEKPCRLAEFPPLDLLGSMEAVAALDFEFPGQAGIVGAHRTGKGKWGQSLVLDAPDGRLDVDLNPGDLGDSGTVQWWVRPRPAVAVWSDQGRHVFMHATSTGEPAVWIELSRNPAAGLALTAATADGAVMESVHLDVREADDEAWHHLAVSWDFSGKRQYLWLLFDGSGTQLHLPRRFPRCRFTRLVFGNTPPGDTRPFLPMDGAIDHILVNNTPLLSKSG